MFLNPIQLNGIQAQIHYWRDGLYLRRKLRLLGGVIRQNVMSGCTPRHTQYLTAKPVI